jgi:aminoglycoside/choline kinase family phosphotransferase
MKPGDKVRFIEPEEDEEGVVFEVLEDRDDRVLVRALELFEDWYLKPTSVYLKSDLELATN